MKPWKLHTLYLLCLIVSLPCLSAIIRAEDTLKARGAKTNPSESARVIQFVNEQLTVQVKDLPLQEVLEEIARQGALALVLSGAIEERITIELHQLPLEEGLRRILRQRNFAVEYSTTSEESPSTVRRPRTLWIFSKGEEGYPAQTTFGDDSKGGNSPQDGASDIQTLRATLSSEDSVEREEAVEALGESGRTEAVAPLTLALKDVDKDVRQATIAALANIGGAEAAQALAVALQDEDAAIREAAVEALSEIGSVEAAHALATALQDQDAVIREAAVEALGDIGGESAIRLLEQALTDEDESVREAAAEVLEELSNQTR